MTMESKIKIYKNGKVEMKKNYDKCITDLSKNKQR